MNKSILTIEGLDGEQKVTCKCGQEMESVDLGVNQYVQAGELVEDDLGFAWHCKECGHTEDE